MTKLAVWGFLAVLFPVVHVFAATPIMTVANNTALKTLKVTGLPADQVVFRMGFTAPGDGGEMSYRPSHAACTLSAVKGGGDDGSQIPSADGQCWIWLPGGVQVTPMVFGAAGNGKTTTNDHDAVQNAMLALGHEPLYLGNHLYTLGSQVGVTTNIIGSGGGQGIYAETCTTGFRGTTTKMDLLAIAARGLTISNICMDSAVPSQGAGIVEAGDHNYTIIQNSQFNRICKAIYLTGVGTHGNLGSRMVNNTIIPYDNEACAAITLGAKSTGGNTTDFIVSGNQIYCNGARAVGFDIYDAGGGVFATNTPPYKCNYGTRIFPGADQVVSWMFMRDGLGDTSNINDLLIDTRARSAVIMGLNFAGTWASCATGDNVVIKNSAGATALNYQGIQFTNHHTYMCANQNRISYSGFKIEYANELRIEGSTICTNWDNTKSGIDFEAKGGDLTVRNSVVGGGCNENTGGSLATAINLGAKPATLNITNNRLDYAATPIVWGDHDGSASLAKAPDQWIIKDNIGIDHLKSSDTDLLKSQISPSSK